MTAPLYIQGRIWQANSYLADNILFDAGILPERILPYKDRIDTIVLTHGHFDHIVHAKEIADLCGAEICIGEFEAQFLSDSALSLSRHFGADQPQINCARTLADGDKVGDFTVYHTPGHTRGSICLFREYDGVLISGDTIFPDGSYGRCDLPTGDMSSLKSSIARIAELPVESLWCGHGTPVPENAKQHVQFSALNVKMEP
ncbi:MAG TPA: MBL fold metallo-hydrolase [Methanocorpusculum sp.]|nr:MBL fold metallo-hydrolase [Methanocorpusculum sp.]